jgi:hypothetical protein
MFSVGKNAQRHICDMDKGHECEISTNFSTPLANFDWDMERNNDYE